MENAHPHEGRATTTTPTSLAKTHAQTAALNLPPPPSRLSLHKQPRHKPNAPPTLLAHRGLRENHSSPPQRPGLTNPPHARLCPHLPNLDAITTAATKRHKLNLVDPSSSLPVPANLLRLIEPPPQPPPAALPPPPAAPPAPPTPPQGSRCLNAPRSLLGQRPPVHTPATAQPLQPPPNRVESGEPASRLSPAGLGAVANPINLLCDSPASSLEPGSSSLGRVMERTPPSRRRRPRAGSTPDGSGALPLSDGPAAAFAQRAGTPMACTVSQQHLSCHSQGPSQPSPAAQSWAASPAPAASAPHLPFATSHLPAQPSPRAAPPFCAPSNAPQLPSTAHGPSCGPQAAPPAQTWPPHYGTSPVLPPMAQLPPTHSPPPREPAPAPQPSLSGYQAEAAPSARPWAAAPSVPATEAPLQPQPHHPQQPALYGPPQPPPHSRYIQQPPAQGVPGGPQPWSSQRPLPTHVHQSACPQASPAPRPPVQYSQPSEPWEPQRTAPPPQQAWSHPRPPQEWVPPQQHGQQRPPAPMHGQTAYAQAQRWPQRPSFPAPAPHLQVSHAHARARACAMCSDRLPPQQPLGSDLCSACVNACLF